MTNPVTLTPRQVERTVEGEQAGGVLPVLPLAFTPVRDYTTFAAEFCITEGDIVFHFYATDEVNRLADPQKYWIDQFPAVLEPTAKEHFGADYPRLKAKYTDEMASWWTRAYGFGFVLNPHKFIYAFLDKLDAALDVAMNSK